MQARYYDPVIGRFYSNDPMGVRDIHSFNRYAYVNNNPYKYTDPNGMEAVSTYIPYIIGKARLNTPMTDGKGGLTVHLGDIDINDPAILISIIDAHEKHHIARFYQNCSGPRCKQILALEKGFGLGIEDQIHRSEDEIASAKEEIELLELAKKNKKYRRNKEAILRRILQMKQQIRREERKIKEEREKREKEK
jgi:hypothetical protein